MVYLLVSQDDHRQLGLHPQEAVQFSFSQREAASVRRVHHVHQNVSPSQVIWPVAPQILTTTNCSTENTPQTFLTVSAISFSTWGARVIYQTVGRTWTSLRDLQAWLVFRNYWTTHNKNWLLLSNTRPAGFSICGGFSSWSDTRFSSAGVLIINKQGRDIVLLSLSRGDLFAQNKKGLFLSVYQHT